MVIGRVMKVETWNHFARASSRAKYLEHIILTKQGTEKWLVGLLMIFSILLCSNQLMDYYHHSRFLALSGLAGIFSVYLLASKTERKSTNLSYIGISLVILTAISGLSILWAEQKSEAIFYTQKWIYTTSIYFLLHIVFSRRTFTELGFLLSKITRITTVVILVIVSIAMIRISLDEGYSNESLYQLKVLFGHKSLISTYLLLLLPLNLLGPNRKDLNLGLLALVIFQVLLILLIQSRSMYLALGVFNLIVVDYIVRNRKEWFSVLKLKQISIALFGLIILASLLLRNTEFRERLNVLHYLKSQTATERQDVWRMTKPLVKEHWVWGVGSGNWKIQFPSHGVEGSYRMQDQNVFFTRAHNDFLEILAELGVLGGVTYMAIFGFALYKLHRCRKRYPWQSRMLLSGVVGFMISSLIDFPKERVEFLTILALYLVLVDFTSDKQDTRQFLGGSIMLGAIAVLMSANIYTGILRYRGEHNTALMLKARNAGKWKEVIRFSDAAENQLHHLDPYSVPIQFYRGIADYQLGNLDEAQKEFQQAHEYAPYNFQILNNLATIELEKKNYEKADRWLSEAIRINSRFEDALYNLSYSKAMQGQYSEALQILDNIPSQSEKKQMFRQEILDLQEAKSN